MLTFEAKVYKKNRVTRQITLDIESTEAFETCLRLGRITGLTVRVKETGEQLYFIPAVYCGKLLYTRRVARDGSTYNEIDLKPALQAMEEATGAKNT